MLVPGRTAAKAVTTAVGVVELPVREAQVPQALAAMGRKELL